MANFVGNGALMHLGQVGVDDMAFSGNAQATAFKGMKKRVMRYVHQWIKLGKPEPRGFCAACSNGSIPAGHEYNVHVPRSGDLLNGATVHLYIRTPDYPLCTLFPGVPSAFAANPDTFFRGLGIILQQRELFGADFGSLRDVRSFRALWSFGIPWASWSAGGTTVEQVYGELEAFKGAKNQVVGDTVHFNPETNECIPCTVVAVPLKFSMFGTSSVSSMPLICLHRHNVNIRFRLDQGTQDRLIACEVYGNYIFLDARERGLFAQNMHEYQFTTNRRRIVTSTVSPSGWCRVPLNFFTNLTTFFAFSVVDEEGGFADPKSVVFCRLLLGEGDSPRMEGPGFHFFHRRLTERGGDDYCHAGSALDDNDDDKGSESGRGMYLMHFAAPNSETRGAELMSHGCLNMNRFNSVILEIRLHGGRWGVGGKQCEIHIFQEHANLLRINVGMAAAVFIPV